MARAWDVEQVGFSRGRELKAENLDLKGGKRANQGESRVGGFGVCTCGADAIIRVK